MVQREGKARQPGRRVEKSGKARAVGEARDQEGEEDRPAARAGPRVGHRQERQRKEHGARVAERHPGAVVASGLDGTLSVDAVGEREKVGKQPPRGLGQRHGLARGASRQRPPRRKRYSAEFGIASRSGKSCGPASRSASAPAARAAPIARAAAGPRRRKSSHAKYTAPAATPWKNDSGCPPQNESHRAAAVSPIARRPGSRARRRKPEQQERKRRRRGPHAPAVPEQEIRREAPADGAGQRRPLAEAEVAKEEVARKQPEKQRERAGERPRERHREPDGEPRRRMQNARLRGAEEGVARENEAVPERQAALGQRLPDGRPPREIREREVREDRVLRRARRLRRSRATSRGRRSRRGPPGRRASRGASPRP